MNVVVESVDGLTYYIELMFNINTSRALIMVKGYSSGGLCQTLDFIVCRLFSMLFCLG